MKKKLFFYLLALIMLIYGLVDMMNYNKNNYDVTGFIFICNPNTCEVRHKKSNGETKYTDKIYISSIKEFYTELETIPKTKNKGLVLYARRTDGTHFRFSPIYIRPSAYVDEELITPLNRALKKDPIKINMKFP